MTAKELNVIRSSVRDISPLVHCITNPISINQCANAVLAVGCRPIMAEHPEEVGEITAFAHSLMLNLGNITDVRMKSIIISAKIAADNKIPFVLDAVGVSCSSLRRGFAGKLLKSFRPDIIKGNYSEIAALAFPDYRTGGVDADTSLDTDTTIKTALRLAEQYNTTILASGKTDIITDGKSLILINNGTPQLAGITGTGCMLGALCGCYMTHAKPLWAAVCACAALGICGELSETERGSGTFSAELMNKLSVLPDKDFEMYLKMEEREIESI